MNIAHCTCTPAVLVCDCHTQLDTSLCGVLLLIVISFLIFSHLYSEKLSVFSGLSLLSILRSSVLSTSIEITYQPVFVTSVNN